MEGFKPKVVILCGGQGTRLREETEFKPKPLVTVGKKPILWHIMKLYAHYGFKDFILCLGYKGDMIKDYFLNHSPRNFDFTINTKTRNIHIHNGDDVEDWNITFVDTGEETKTSGRILQIRKFVGDDPYFLATYGDGLANVKIDKIIAHHLQHKKTATLTGVNPVSRYGLVKTTPEMKVIHFEEKPVLKGDIINAGFFVFNPDIFKYLREDEMLEESLPRVAQFGDLMVYYHDGSFHSMDTYRDFMTLNDLWHHNKAPWKVWDSTKND